MFVLMAMGMGANGRTRATTGHFWDECGESLNPAINTIAMSYTHSTTRHTISNAATPIDDDQVTSADATITL
mgnify:CR=1 FL=1